MESPHYKLGAWSLKKVDVYHTGSLMKRCIQYSLVSKHLVTKHDNVSVDHELQSSSLKRKMKKRALEIQMHSWPTSQSVSETVGCTLPIIIGAVLI